MGIAIGALVGAFIYLELVGPYGGRIRLFGTTAITYDTLFFICVPGSAIIGGVYLAYKARYRRQQPWQP